MMEEGIATGKIKVGEERWWIVGVNVRENLQKKFHLYVMIVK